MTKVKVYIHNPVKYMSSKFRYTIMNDHCVIARISCACKGLTDLRSFIGSRKFRQIYILFFWSFNDL